MNSMAFLEDLVTHNALSGYFFFTLQTFCLYIVVSDFSFYEFSMSVNVCVCLGACLFLAI